MSITQSKLNTTPLSLEELIEYTEGAIKQQTATIETLKAEGHEVAEASNYLNQTIRNLAALKSKRNKDAA